MADDIKIVALRIKVAALDYCRARKRLTASVRRHMRKIQESTLIKSSVEGGCRGVVVRLAVIRRVVNRAAAWVETNGDQTAE